MDLTTTGTLCHYRILIHIFFHRFPFCGDTNEEQKQKPIQLIQNKPIIKRYSVKNKRDNKIGMYF